MIDTPGKIVIRGAKEKRPLRSWIRSSRVITRLTIFILSPIEYKVNIYFVIVSPLRNKGRLTNILLGV